ncbi:MAG: CdaR family protein [Anaerolineae bacterium]
MKVGQTVTLAILSIVLAFFFWAVATEAEDPMVEKPLPYLVPVEIRGVPDGRVAYGIDSVKARVVLRAPESLWEILQTQTSEVQAYVDLSNVESGMVTAPVQVEINRSPVQRVRISPEEITLQLEPVAEQDVPVAVTVEDTPAQGFVARSPSYVPRTVTVRGPQSLVVEVVRCVVSLSVADKRQTVEDDFQLSPVNETGDEVPYVEVIPKTVTVEVPIEQLGNIRDLAVNVVLSGHPAAGYRVGAVEVEPPVVTVTGRRDVVQAAPLSLGTEPITLDDVSESFTTTVGLQLPEGLSVLTTPQVLVNVNIEAVRSEVTIPLEPEVRGLTQGYTVTVSPAAIQVVISGPFEAVKALDPLEVESFVDVTGLTPGEHTVAPEVVLPDDSLQVDSILPQSSLVVEIQEVPEAF